MAYAGCRVGLAYLARWDGDTGPGQGFARSKRWRFSKGYTTHIWQHTGWESILYLAAISSIDSELYESAVIDGANRMQKIRFITLPSISFIVGLLLIFAVGRLLDAGFELILLLYSEPVYGVADIMIRSLSELAPRTANAGRYRCRRGQVG